jgi:hypothetical protein
MAAVTAILPNKRIQFSPNQFNFPVNKKRMAASNSSKVGLTVQVVRFGPELKCGPLQHLPVHEDRKIEEPAMRSIEVLSHCVKTHHSCTRIGGIPITLMVPNIYC